MRPSHHNTTDEVGPELQRLEKKAQSQDEKILGLYRKYWYIKISPSQAQAQLEMQDVPITSVRRAITNLTKQGHLVKTDKKVAGLYGRMEYCWQGAAKPGRQQQLL